MLVHMYTPVRNNELAISSRRAAKLQKDTPLEADLPCLPLPAGGVLGAVGLLLLHAVLPERSPTSAQAASAGWLQA